MKKILVYLPLLISLILFSCNSDDEITSPPVDLYNVDIGSYELLPESRAAYPYQDKSQVQFVDSLGNEMIFQIQEQVQFVDFGPSILYKYNVYDAGDTVRYEYQYQSMGSWLNNDSLSLDFSISLAARPYYDDPESLAVADVLNISLKGNVNTYMAFSVFYHVLDQRTWPEAFNFNENFTTINLFGRDFNNVWKNTFFNANSNVYYNNEFGILYFTDHDGKAWRFDQFIE